MKIKPEFLVGDLEFSRVLKKKYTWDEIINKKFKDGWRVPKLRELLMLYEECKESHQDGWFWSASSYAKYSYYAWLIFFGNGFNGIYSKSHTHRVRLVREIPNT